MRRKERRESQVLEKGELNVAFTHREESKEGRGEGEGEPSQAAHILRI